MKKSKKVLTIGDALVTMNPITKGPLRFVTHFERRAGGAELNFAIGMARLGVECKWISRLGKDEFGRAIFNFARGEGVDMTDVEFTDEYPTSLNFKQINEDGSGSTFYYRHPSPTLTMTKSLVTDDLLSDIDLIHITGVFLSINKNNIEIIETLLKKAKEFKIPVSFDPNIRLKMWTIEEARATFERIFPYVDIMLTGLDELKMITNKIDEIDFIQFVNDYDIKELVIKDGENGSKLYCNNTWYEQEAFNVNVVDTVGAGDGFDAGYIYGYLHEKDYESRLCFANGVGALVTTVSGDNEGLPYIEEVEAFINNIQLIER